MYIEDNFLVHVLKKLTTLVEIATLRYVGLTKSKVRILNFGRVNFRLFEEQLDEIPMGSCP